MFVYLRLQPEIVDKKHSAHLTVFMYILPQPPEDTRNKRSAESKKPAGQFLCADQSSFPPAVSYAVPYFNVM